MTPLGENQSCVLNSQQPPLKWDAPASSSASQRADPNPECECEGCVLMVNIVQLAALTALQLKQFYVCVGMS